MDGIVSCPKLQIKALLLEVCADRKAKSALSLDGNNAERSPKQIWITGHWFPRSQVQTTSPVLISTTVQLSNNLELKYLWE